MLEKARLAPDLKAIVEGPSLNPTKSAPLKWVLGSVALSALLAVSDPAIGAESADVYLGLYFVASLPRDTQALLDGAAARDTVVGNSLGGGLKVGIFPQYTNRIIGVELEHFGHGGQVTFTVPTGSSVGLRAMTDLTVLNSMVNFLLRYPGNAIQPYGGAGIGYSSGILTGTDIPGRADRGFETAPAFAHQFMAGLQGNLTERTFLFSEYKYFSANYHWEKLALDFRTHYVLAGIGLRF